MNMNCLTCQSIIRTDSEKEYREKNGKGKVEEKLSLMVERSWSGNLAPRPEKIRNGSSLVPTKKVKKAPHRVHSGPIGSVEFNEDEPKLVRSCGMRRDWSFEDLRQIIKG